MIKKAFELGMKLAQDQAGLTPEQMAAARKLWGIGGGAVGAGLGGLLGSRLGDVVSENLDTDEETSKLVGSALGALLGGGLGGYAGSQIPLLRYQQRSQKKELEEGPESNQGLSAFSLPPQLMIPEIPVSEPLDFGGESTLGLLPEQGAFWEAPSMGLTSNLGYTPQYEEEIYSPAYDYSTEYGY